MQHTLNHGPIKHAIAHLDSKERVLAILQKLTSGHNSTEFGGGGGANSGSAFGMSMAPGHSRTSSTVLLLIDNSEGVLETSLARLQRFLGSLLSHTDRVR